MARLPLRGLAAGFTAGAAAGWLVGLLRTPTDPPDDTGAQAAARMPQESFGQAPVEKAAGTDELRGASASTGDVADAPAVEPAPPPAAATAAASVAPPASADAEPTGPGSTEPLAPVQPAVARVGDLHEATTAAFASAAGSPAKRVRKKAAPKVAAGDAGEAAEGAGADPAVPDKPAKPRARRAPRKALPPTVESADADGPPDAAESSDPAGD